MEYLAKTNSDLRKKGLSKCFKIMNEKFINRNKNKFNLIYNNKKLKKDELFKYQKEGQKIKIKIVGIYNISNVSYMFDGCDTLESFACRLDDYQISELSKDENYECLDGGNINNNKKITLDEKKNYFLPTDKDKYLSYLSEIEKLTESTTNEENQKYLLILKTFIEEKVKITNISHMFNGCKKLKTLNGIEYLKTELVKDFSFLFNKCSSLTSLPDISVWNTESADDLNHIFSECTKLIKLPDISKWKIDKVINIDKMFFKCEKFTSLPDLSIWNTNNIYYMHSLFHGCKNLLGLSDIFKWKTNKVVNMKNMFLNCSLLTKLRYI